MCLIICSKLQLVSFWLYRPLILIIEYLNKFDNKLVLCSFNINDVIAININFNYEYYFNNKM